VISYQSVVFGDFFRLVGRYVLPVFLITVFARECLAPQTPSEPSLRQRRRLAGAYLTKRLSFWQERLMLQDWHISLLQSTQQDLRGGTLGNIHWDQPQKTATIRFLRADEYHMPYRETVRDMEFTLVHELIHLELVSLPRSDASRRDEEYAVNHLAEALIAMDRGK